MGIGRWEWLGIGNWSIGSYQREAFSVRVLMFMVQQRAREFSVRLAVGASARDLLRLVLGDGLKLTAIGVAIGVAASAMLARSLATLLFGVPPLDPLTFVVAPLALASIAMLACLAPALRALRTDPIAALRSE